MASKNSGMSSSILLSLAVGAFLVLSGIHNLIDPNSALLKAGGIGALFNDTTKTIVLVAAILKIVSGAVLVIGPLGLLTISIRQLAFWVIVIFWVAFTLWLAITDVSELKGNGAAILGWFEALFLNLAVLAALWHLKPAGK